eukprot:CAMPEP_0177394260 /NCGR_PEP_ID=MMETSP0368-20130122/55433_1 /TAXON_ID=447022 ORGANISM="Scrippsiella hangoei-like, Strain SHHI-4" /NCGR_SAMPLE_ID=MMETSP0368 /ASSEMBLY_ACC=CAM_ASM_000363 /LENGTH=59 /DNA_ID=CAMNT_0018860585 /DNA_START=142 /DNA_END=318 /DNA_ORIENTATION=+
MTAADLLSSSHGASKRMWIFVILSRSVSQIRRFKRLTKLRDCGSGPSSSAPTTLGEEAP